MCICVYNIVNIIVWFIVDWWLTWSLSLSSYVSRQRPNDSASHEVLGVQQFKPLELAEQINLNMNNAWGILMTLIDIFLKKEQGKYLILKDPNKVDMLIYNNFAIGKFKEVQTFPW